jgi:acetolactate synthase-1/2/3 large subunit
LTATGASLLAEQLRLSRVEKVFTLNGGHIAPIYDALIDGGPAIVDVRHEDAAVHMAHAYARMTRVPGVACLTAGPGVTNGVTAIASAWAAASPVVVIGGKVPIPQLDLGALQDIDQISLMRPVTRSARTVIEANRIPEYFAEAMRLSAVAPHSPTFLEIPTDVLRSQVPADQARYYTDVVPPFPAPDTSALEAVASSLRSAQRPLIVAGSGVLWSGAEAEVRRLAETLRIPVLTTSLARGLLPPGHPLDLYAARSHLLRSADLVLVLGTRFNFVLNYGRPPRIPSETTLVHVDASADEVNRNRRADIAIVADARATIEQLLAQMEPVAEDERAWLVEARSIHAQACETHLQPETAGAIHPLRLCHEVVGAAPPGTRFVVDGGDILSYGRLAIHPNGPRRYLDSGPYGCLGVGVPFANAMKLAAPEDPVVCVTGDGALGLNVMELDTSVRHGIPIVVVVANNAAWGIERNAQIADFGHDRVIATELRDARFDQVAQALGCKGRRVTSAAEIPLALQEALRSGEPSLIDVVTDVDVLSPDLKRGLATVPDDAPVEWVKS